MGSHIYRVKKINKDAHDNFEVLCILECKNIVLKVLAFTWFQVFYDYLWYIILLPKILQFNGFKVFFQWMVKGFSATEYLYRELFIRWRLSLWRMIDLNVN